MKEILINEGFRKVGGCMCNGGAEFYRYDDRPFFRIDWYTKANFLILKLRNKQIKKGSLNDIQEFITEVKK